MAGGKEMLAGWIWTFTHSLVLTPHRNQAWVGGSGRAGTDLTLEAFTGVKRG